MAGGYFRRALQSLLAPLQGFGWCPLVSTGPRMAMEGFVEFVGVLHSLEVPLQGFGGLRLLPSVVFVVGVGL